MSSVGSTAFPSPSRCVATYFTQLQRCLIPTHPEHPFWGRAKSVALPEWWFVAGYGGSLGSPGWHRGTVPLSLLLLPFSTSWYHGRQFTFYLSFSAHFCASHDKMHIDPWHALECKPSCALGLTPSTAKGISRTGHTPPSRVSAADQVNGCSRSMMPEVGFGRWFICLFAGIVVKSGYKETAALGTVRSNLITLHVCAFMFHDYRNTLHNPASGFDHEEVICVQMPAIQPGSSGRISSTFRSMELSLHHIRWETHLTDLLWILHFVLPSPPAPHHSTQPDPDTWTKTHSLWLFGRRRKYLYENREWDKIGSKDNTGLLSGRQPAEKTSTRSCW